MFENNFIFICYAISFRVTPRIAFYGFLEISSRTINKKIIFRSLVSPGNYDLHIQIAIQIIDVIEGGFYEGTNCIPHTLFG